MSTTFGQTVIDIASFKGQPTQCFSRSCREKLVKRPWGLDGILTSSVVGIDISRSRSCLYLPVGTLPIGTGVLSEARQDVRSAVCGKDRLRVSSAIFQATRSEMTDARTCVLMPVRKTLCITVIDRCVSARPSVSIPDLSTVAADRRKRTRFVKSHDKEDRWFGDREETRRAD